jgi:selenocysteine lyase/cysteine desulfurase
MTPSDLSALRAAYRHFLEPDRILLTGHSHQAWPDVAREAQSRVFDDAARWVDDKWDAAIFPLVDGVGRRVLERMGFAAGDAIAFAGSTHELVYRLMSAVPLVRGSKVVTTGGEFHSLWRQLRRLGEEGVEVTWVAPHPRATLLERLQAALSPGVALVAASAVFFEDAYVFHEVGELMARAVDGGAVALVDAYHAFNVVPFDWGAARDQLYVVAGGYKYAAFGNGVSWMRIPAASDLRPVYTGWFADFEGLSGERGDGAVRYGSAGARFAGATFDPSALYRADAVLDHWDRFGLTPALLRRISLEQTRRILTRLEASGLGSAIVSAREDARRGGFVTLRVAAASRVVGELRHRGVWVDARGDLLRLGPAPYLTDDEIDRGVTAVVEACSAR